MHILLTRPIEDSQELILKLQLSGHKISHLPVIKIDKVNYDEINHSDYDGIIFTSSNAVKNLNCKNINKNIYCFSVGSATEKSARNIGFQNVFSADGNVNNLKEIILQNFDKKKGKLLYVSGETISSNLDKDLISEGYSIKRLINYKVLPNEKFDPNFMKELKSSMPDIVYVYSQNSAKSLLNIIKKYELVDCCMNTNLMCIGEKTSSILNEVKWKKIFLFSPGEEEFLLYKI